MPELCECNHLAREHKLMSDGGHWCSGSGELFGRLGDTECRTLCQCDQFTPAPLPLPVFRAGT